MSKTLRTGVTSLPMLEGDVRNAHHLLNELALLRDLNVKGGHYALLSFDAVDSGQLPTIDNTNHPWLVASVKSMLWHRINHIERLLGEMGVEVTV